MIDRATLAIGRAAAWVFLAAVAVTVWEVTARYLFGAPTRWAHETTTTLCAVGFALGGAYAFVRNEHIRITVLVDRLPARGRAACEVIALVVGVIYLAGLFHAALGQAIEAVWRFEAGSWAPELTAGPPNWPLPAIVRTGLAVGAFLFLLVVAQRLVRRR
ncbi:TRAP transporter small permease subunit [Elioraea sp.]|uniref:TRAP transporter small permease subunit n=1 Tax=Elioraea sp. TaxID=2185103 RepID=UPI0025C65E6B|nr:TRAP transporter small permease subunit [Elioraea sp.]